MTGNGLVQGQGFTLIRTSRGQFGRVDIKRARSGRRRIGRTRQVIRRGCHGGLGGRCFGNAKRHARQRVQMK
eukprot:scaffold1588_cov222-Amphora_coffeaeformis.AAC.9